KPSDSRALFSLDCTHSCKLVVVQGSRAKGNLSASRGSLSGFWSTTRSEKTVQRRSTGGTPPFPAQGPRSPSGTHEPAPLTPSTPAPAYRLAYRRPADAGGAAQLPRPADARGHEAVDDGRHSRHPVKGALGHRSRLVQMGVRDPQPHRRLPRR